MAALVAKAVIQGVDRASPVFRQVAAAAGGLHRKLSGMSGAMGRAAGAQRRMAYGLQGSNGLGAGLAAAGFLANQLAFEDAMNRTRAVLNITDKKAFKPHEDLVVSLAQKYPATSAQIAKGASEIAMAGMSMSQVNSVLEAAVQGAMASGESIKNVAMGVTDVVMALGQDMTGKNFGYINDMLAAASTSYSQDYMQLLEGFRKVAPLARMTGISARQTAALLGVLANAGFKAEKGGTALRTMLMRLSAPTKAARVQLAKYGLTLEQFKGRVDSALVSGSRGVKRLAAMLRERGIAVSLKDTKLQAILDNGRLHQSPAKLRAAIVEHIKKGLSASDSTNDLQEAVNDFVDSAYRRIDVMGLFRALGRAGAMNDAKAMKEIFALRFSAQGSSLAHSMFKIDPKTGVSVFDTMARNFENRVEGAVERFAAILMSGLPGAIRRLGGAFDALLRTMANSGAMDTIVRAIEGMRDGINALSAASPTLLKFATLGLVALGVLAPIGFALAGIAAGFSAIAALAGVVAAAFTPVTLVVLGLAYAAFEVYRNWDQIRAHIIETLEGWKSNLQAALDSIRLLFSDPTQWGKNLLMEQLEKVAGWIVRIRNLASKAINWWGGSSAPAPAAPKMPAPSSVGTTPTPRISGARARGGPVRAGGSYLVGERGPELFTPGRSGTIVPNHRLGGGANVTVAAPQVSIQITMPEGTSPHEMIRAVRTRLTEELRDAFRGAIADTGIA